MKTKTQRILNKRALLPFSKAFIADAKSAMVNLNDFFDENPDRDDFGLCEFCDEWYFNHKCCPCGQEEYFRFHADYPLDSEMLASKTDLSRTRICQIASEIGRVGHGRKLAGIRWYFKQSAVDYVINRPWKKSGPKKH